MPRLSKISTGVYRFMMMLGHMDLYTKEERGRKVCKPVNDPEGRSGYDSSIAGGLGRFGWIWKLK